MDNRNSQSEGRPRELDGSSSPIAGNGSMKSATDTVCSLQANGASLTVVSPETKTERPMPVWMQRTCLIIYVLFCLEVGLMLTLIPWTQAWNHNTYIFSSAWMRSLLQTGFVRGLVTGIGLIDIWLGIWEAVQYRDVRPA